jgi:uncharacterized protein
VNFECDPDKAQQNIRKHGVAFDEAVTCLLDPMALCRSDPDVAGELRFVLLDMSARGRVLVVVYTMRGESPRIISARKSTRSEAKNYA